MVAAGVGYVARKSERALVKKERHRVMVVDTLTNVMTLLLAIESTLDTYSHVDPTWKYSVSIVTEFVPIPVLFATECTLGDHCD